jgi:dihydroxy-acid dehydratase
VEDGDPVEINIPERRLELHVEEDELDRRQEAWTPREPKITTGYLARYAKSVTSAATGAVYE